MKNHQFSSLSPSTKIHKNWSQDHPKSSEIDLEIIRIPISVKTCFLQHLPHQMLVYEAPGVQIQTPKSFKKVTWKQAWKKDTYLDPSDPKNLKTGSRNQPKIDENPSLDPNVSFLEAPGAPGSSHGPPGCQSGGTRHDKWPVLGTKSDNIRLLNQSYSKKYALKTNIQKPASQQTHFSRGINKETKTKHPQ